MRILKCDPETEIIGQSMMSILENLQADEIHPILVKNNLTEINAEQWYKAQGFLDALNDVMDSPGAMSNMVAVGMAVAEKMVMPPDLVHAPLPVILGLWNDLYHLQHHGDEIGYVKTEEISPTHYRTIHDHIYPDDMVYGLAYGMARRFLPKGTHFTVRYDPDSTRKDDGGSTTVVDVLW